MTVAPPPLAGSRIQELGDGLIVGFRPRRSWGELAFLIFWLTFWSFFGVMALAALPAAGWGQRAFLLVWLGGWALGEGTAIVGVAWLLFGREAMTVTPTELQVRMTIGRFGRTRRFDAGLVEEVRAAQVPSDENSKPREDFCLQIVHDGKTARIGEGMGEREAEYVASNVLARIRPRPRWSDEQSAELWGTSNSEGLYASVGDQTEATVGTDEPNMQPAAGRRRGVAAVFPILVVACMAAIALSGREDSPRQSQIEPRREPVGIPVARDFSDPREYAAAVTLHVLASARTTVLEPPDCGASVTWTAWSCSARARATIGPLSGRIQTYRCAPTPIEEESGWRTAESITCGPEDPHRPRVKTVPSTRDFSNPREFATALTLFGLTSAKNKVLGRPDCGKRVTWEEWNCTVRARAENGPFAGRTLIYHCYPTAVERAGGRPTVSVSQCGPVNPPPIIPPTDE